MVVLQHVQLVLTVFATHNVTFDQDLAQLVDQLSERRGFRDLDTHSSHRVCQLAADLLEPPRLVHLFQLLIDELESLLELEYLGIFLVDVFTDLGSPQVL